MPANESVQLNIRSRFARVRAAGLARETGMTVTQVVEEALRAYQPPLEAPVPGRLVRKGPLLVGPARRGRVTVAQTNAAIDAVRLRKG